MGGEKVHMKEWRQRPLYRVLYERLPWLRSKIHTGILDVHKLARAIGYSPEAVYRWLRRGKISPSGANVVVKKSRNKIAIQHLSRHVRP